MIANENRSDSVAHLPGRHREQSAERVRENTWVDVQGSDVDVCLLPVGSIEQHGPHAPLGTDVFVAESVAAAAARQSEALSLPPVQAGIAPYHSRFPGSIDIPYEVFRDYAYHVLAATEAWGVETVVAVNGHGGNRAALKDTCRRVTQDTGLDAHYWAWTDAVEEEVTHAGSAETSVLSYLVPELVETPQEGAVESWGEWIHGAQVAKFTDEFTENGVVGDPTRATAEEGQRLFETAVGELAALLEWLRETDRQGSDAKPNGPDGNGGQP
jgi:creatinine amidohydrolase